METEKWKLIAGNCVSDYEAMDQEQQILYAENSLMWVKDSYLAVYNKSLLTRVMRMLYNNASSGFLQQFPSLYELYKLNARLADRITFTLIMSHQLQHQTKLSCVLPIVEQHLIVQHQNKKNMKQQQDPIKALTIEIDKHIMACDANRTPTICRMRSNPTQLSNLINKIINRVSMGDGMTIGEAINSIEIEYNQNRIDD